MASPPHRANNLLVDAEHVGVGYTENLDTQHHTYWVVVFGRSYERPFTLRGAVIPDGTGIHGAKSGMTGYCGRKNPLGLEDGR